MFLKIKLIKDYGQINTIISDGLAKYGETISFDMELKVWQFIVLTKKMIIYWGGQDFIVALKFKHSLTDSAPISK